MNGSTLDRLNYRLRTAKNIERKMLCEAFARLSRLHALPKFRYIGFGSLGFYDFSLFHEKLGITNMVSIEGRVDAKARVEFNKPYDCIEMRWGESHAVLPGLDWNPPTIIWLDYDKPLDARILEDINLVSSEVASGSVMVVTVPADPRIYGRDNLVKRLERLKEYVGANKIPNRVKPAQMKQWQLAEVLRGILENDIYATLADRNGASSAADEVHYEQIFNINYADGMKMLTVGGLFLNEQDRSSLAAADFADLEFISTGDKAYQISNPYLTIREMRHLDQLLPGALPSGGNLSWLRREDITEYAKIYRYYPNFTEVEA